MNRIPIFKDLDHRVDIVYLHLKATSSLNGGRITVADYYHATGLKKPKKSDTKIGWSTIYAAHIFETNTDGVKELIMSEPERLKLKNNIIPE